MSGSLAWAGQTLASPSYPSSIDQALSAVRGEQISCSRPLSRCLNCHTTAAGGANTATQSFILALQMYTGFAQGEEPGMLRDAIAGFNSMTDEDMDGLSDFDSDADGVPDLDELANCLNPSGPEYGVPEYGCDGATLGSRAPRRGAWCFGLAALLALATIVGRGQHRRRARRSAG